MKNSFLFSVLLFCAVFVWPGASCRISRDGASIDPVRPSGNAVVHVRVSKIGIQVGQNQATQTPEANIGWQSVAFDVVPTSTNKLYTVPVENGIGAGVDGFDASIKEKFATGDKVSGKVCENAKAAGRTVRRVTLANLNANFDRGTLTDRHRALLWTLEQVLLIKPELRGTSRDSTFLTVRGLRNAGFSGDTESPEWCVRNRAGWPVSPRSEFLRPSVNLLADGAPSVILRTEKYGSFDRIVIWSTDGAWNVEKRLAGDELSPWQFVRAIASGQTVALTAEADFLPVEFRAIRQ